MIQPLIFAITMSVLPQTADLPRAYDNLEVINEIIEQDKCVEWTGVAVKAGWPIEELPKLFRIMYRESRCNPLACSESDSGRICRDWGLMQINDYSWKSTIRRFGLPIESMWVPFWNLWFAKWLYDYSLDRNGDGWTPWKLPGNNP